MTALRKYIETCAKIGDSQSEMPTFGKEQLRTQMPACELQRLLEEERAAHARSVAEYEARLSILKDEFEAKAAARVREERNKAYSELKSVFESEESAKLKKLLAAKEEQLKAQVRSSLYE